jgi:PAS domain S-box-containing protein
LEYPLLSNLALAVVHVLAAQAGLLLAHPETHVTLVWPPSGIALAAILLLGYRVWPGLFIGDLIVAVMEGHPPLMWALGPLGNTLAAVVGAWILQTVVDFDPRLRRVKDVFWLALGGGLLATMIGATLGVYTLTVSGRIPAQQALGAWLSWWLGDTVGVSVIAPTLLILGTKIKEGDSLILDGHAWSRAALPFTLLIAVSATVFGGFSQLLPRRAGLPVAFAVFPALIWIAVRFDVAGSSLAVLITAIIGITGTALGYGPFTGSNPNQNLGVLWSFVGIMALTTLPLGAAVRERRRAEGKLAVRQQLWESLMANTPDLVYFKDADHGLIMASQTYADAVGCGEEELVGKTAADLWPHEAAEILADERRVLTGEPMIRNERKATTADGEAHWYLLTKIPIYQDGEVVGFFAIDKDITERKRTEEQLAFQSMLLDQIQDMVTATDLDGQITYVNQAECRAFGQPAEEMIGRSVTLYGEDPQVGATQQEIIDTTLTEGRWRGEVVNVTADGRKIILDSRVQLIQDEQGEPVGMLGVSTDITERKVMEKELRQQERLAAVGQLASGIAHDFRNLLTTIILYAELPLRRDNLPPDLTKNLKTIAGEAEKATDLVQQILDFSSSAMIERQPLDMKPFVEEVLTILKRTLPETIDITLEAGPGPHLVRADPGRLQQALTNLATNARDAMPGGGELRLTLSRLQLASGEAPPMTDAPTRSSTPDPEGMAGRTWVRLTVSDTGTGMSERVQEHLFEPFFTTKDVGRGTGLGLAQVYGIVRQHGGAIDVETEPGEGTAFHLYLPAHSETGDQTEEREERGTFTAPQGRGETILLVEDEEHVRRATRQMLETLGYQVVTASNGREALALCQSPRWSGNRPSIDLVITDLVMPEMGGRDLVRELSATRHGPKALGITGYALEEDDLAALRASGFLGVIRKPFEAEDLATPIRRALET